MTLFGPLITARAIELARQRIINPSARLCDEKGRNELESRSDVKMALILVLEMNPSEWLTNAEEGVRRGLTAEKVGKLNAAGELR